MAPSAYVSSEEYSPTTMKMLAGYRDALDRSSIVSVTDPKGIILYANDLFCELSGYSREELVGKPHNIIRHPDMPKAVFKDLWETIAAKKSWHGIVKNKKKNGGHYWVKTIVMPILDDQGEIVEYISVRTDITDLENTQEKLEKAVEKLQELDVRKNEFINIASHELRTPLSAIYGYVNMILDGDAGEINDEVRTYLEQVERSTQQLIAMVSDMLDVAKLESGEARLFLEPSDFRLLIDEVISSLHPMLLAKSQTLEQNISFASCLWKTDRIKFKQVLTNIVGNAIKYTPEQGKITVETSAENNRLTVKVSDTGIGIPKAHLWAVFEKFFQVKNSLTRDTPGTGLGLSITKKIMEEFWWTVSVESTEKVGSTFIVTFPI